MSIEPRGYRNFNPGNLIKGKSNFVGEISGSDSRFRTFVNMKYGFRALIKVLTNYFKGGHNTIEKIIKRYAPEFENATDRYIEFVSHALGVSPVDVLTPDKKTLTTLAYYIAAMENGRNPDLSDVMAGYDYLPHITVKSDTEPPTFHSEPKKKRKLIENFFVIGGIVTLAYLIFKK